jgi:hypothetical protein
VDSGVVYPATLLISEHELHGARRLLVAVVSTGQHPIDRHVAADLAAGQEERLHGHGTLVVDLPQRIRAAYCLANATPSSAVFGM